MTNRITGNGIELKPFYSGESWGGLGGGYAFDMQIGYTDRDLDDEDRHLVRKYITAIEEIIRARTYRESPAIHKMAELEKTQILAAFKNVGVIYARAVPNQYDSDVRGEMFPWFMVTTTCGHFLVGYRRHVINLDWSATDIEAVADDLFSSEDVTKGEKYIHCYGLELLQKYIEILMAAR